MKPNLIVSGSANFLDGLAPRLKGLPEFELLVTGDGYQALEALAEASNSVLLTDARIARIGCLDIISRLTHRHFPTPVIAVPDCGKPWFEHRLGRREVLYYLMNPERGDALVNAIEVGFGMGRDDTAHRGLTVSSLLPLLDLEKKTCRMTVRAPNKGRGYLYLRNGILIDAYLNGLSGDPAAREIAGWDRIEVDFSDLSDRRSRRKVAIDLMDLAGATWLREDVDDADAVGRLTAAAGGFPPRAPGAAGILKRYMSEFRRIKGFLGMAVADAGGRLVASESAESAADLARALAESKHRLAAFFEAHQEGAPAQPAALVLDGPIGTLFVTRLHAADAPGCLLIALMRSGRSQELATIHLQNIFMRMMVEAESGSP